MMRCNGCPKCNKSLHYSAGLDEDVCIECGWIQGEPGCDDNYLPEYMYSLAEWHIISGILWKQYRAKQISYIDYGSFVDRIGIL